MLIVYVFICYMLNITLSVSQYLPLLKKLHIPRNKIKFVIFDEILSVFL